MDIVRKYFNVTDDPSKADLALVCVKSPDTGVGYTREDREKGGNGYVPISLQYGPYKATAAREKSLAAGDPVVDPTITDRSYKNKEVTASNASDLKLILDTRAAMNGKPVIVYIDSDKPMIFHEFEKEVDGILMGFGIMDQAVLELISGKAEPSGLLPLQMPANMETVEKQMEDVPHDMQVHEDSQKNKYDFGFGLNWKGVINDQRVKKYRRNGISN
jgi:beta-glucosidase